MANASVIIAEVTAAVSSYFHKSTETPHRQGQVS